MTDHAIPILPSTDFAKTTRLFRAIGFDIAQTGDHWLHVRHGSVEIIFSLSTIDWTSPAYEMADRLCVVRVGDLLDWHRRLSTAKVRWKMMGAPSVTSISTGAWNGVPAFCLTDHDRNILWFVERR